MTAQPPVIVAGHLVTTDPLSPAASCVRACWIAVGRGPTTLPADELRSVRVLRTYVGGWTVYRES
ncbi:hypothetical protein GCM10009555_094190 [Acrocarpospora macrocephala]|uniref:Uncharacterized protein n=1 Tax=Acrocarpospora macrocephala TaxID=150177 RepID=A0A5M3WRP7_9ACTN|nr:hypothetical protein [Acrocarpospora macrocephala]GES11564.1 hypothetical protein Amac_051610 [Acrocarpospora macrocephala]